MVRQIAVSFGDGIGLEIMNTTLHILKEAGAQLDVEVVQIGEELYRIGYKDGFEPRTLRTIQRIGVLLRSPCINPKHIEELPDDDDSKIAAQALREQLDLKAETREFIHQDTSEFTAIISKSNDEDNNIAIFESAISYDSENANPAGLILAATHMLRHIEQEKCAQLVCNALQKTLEKNQEVSAENVISNLELE